MAFDTGSLLAWAGRKRTTLAIVFTDAKNSTALAEDLGDEAMDDVLDAHFTQSRRLIFEHEGYPIKGLGDGDMAVFHTVEAAFDYTLALHADPGHPVLRVRAGIHVGPVTVLDNDVRGRAVNYAARVGSAFRGIEICLSDQAKQHIDAFLATRHRNLPWQEPKAVDLPGIKGSQTLWLVDPTTPPTRTKTAGKETAPPHILASPSRAASTPRWDFGRRPHNFEEVEIISRHNVVIDRRLEPSMARVLAQIDVVERLYVRARHGRVDFEVQRAFIVLHNDGPGILSESDALRDGARQNAYYLRLKDMPAGAISVCIDPEPGKTGLGKSALPPTHGENELSEIARVTPDIEAGNLKAELRISLNPEGIYLADELKSNFSEMEAKHIKAILRAAIGRKDSVVRGQIRKPLIVRERPRED